VQEVFEKLSLEDTLKKTLYDGYSTFEDYEKYGECFIPLKPKDGRS
jgi:hypothetical protein